VPAGAPVTEFDDAARRGCYVALRDPCPTQRLVDGDVGGRANFGRVDDTGVDERASRRGLSFYEVSVALSG